MPRSLLALWLLGGALAGQDLDRIAALEDARSLGDGELVALSRHDDPAVRARAVRALGRIQDPSSAGALVERLGDAAPAVRAEAVFALGQVEGEGTIPALVRLADDGDPATRALAAEALGKRKAVEARAVLEAKLADAEPEVRRSAALAIGFLGRPESIEVLRGALETSPPPDAELEWRLVYAIGRIGGSPAVPILGRAASARETLTRTFAAMYLGRLGDPASASVLRGLTRDGEWMVASLAAAALDKYPGGDSEAALVSALGHAHPHVRGQACRALAGIGAKAALGELFRVAREDPSRAVAREAFYAQIRLGSETARLELEGLGARGKDDRRALALLEAGAEGLAARLAAGDGSAAAGANALFVRGPDRVRAALLSGLAGARPGDDAFFLLLRGLASADLAVRGSAADGLRDAGDLRALGHLAAAYQDSLGREGHYEVRETLVAAAGATDSPMAIPFLERALEDPAPSVRSAAAAAIEKRTGKRPSIPETRAEPPAAPIDRTLRGRKVELETEKGRLVIELFPDDAPVHVANFLTLVAKKHYDGLDFHRVVPAFVVQGGDPRGDGWGDAGYTIRDEIGPRRYVRGTLGMPKAGKDTGGCQLFVTHLPAPHLDGRYTVFGQVAGGLDVLDRLEVGDRILHARILEGE